MKWQQDHYRLCQTTAPCWDCEEYAVRVVNDQTQHTCLQNRLEFPDGGRRCVRYVYEHGADG